MGLTYAEPKIDLGKLRSFKDGVVSKLTGGLGQLSKQRKITFVQGKASFIDAKNLSIELKAGGTDTLAFEHAIIATGSCPTKIPGLSITSDRLMDSTGALDLPEIPKTLLVVGGGYIGLELGSVYAALGTKVTVVEMTDGLLPGADRDLVTFLARRLETVLDKILLKTKVVSMTEAKKGITVKMDGSDGGTTEQTFDRVLVSIGRRPNSAIAAWTVPV